MLKLSVNLGEIGVFTVWSSRPSAWRICLLGVCWFPPWASLGVQDSVVHTWTCYRVAWWPATSRLQCWPGRPTPAGGDAAESRTSTCVLHTCLFPVRALGVRHAFLGVTSGYRGVTCQRGRFSFILSDSRALVSIFQFVLALSGSLTPGTRHSVHFRCAAR